MLQIPGPGPVRFERRLSFTEELEHPLERNLEADVLRGVRMMTSCAPEVLMLPREQTTDHRIGTATGAQCVYARGWGPSRAHRPSQRRAEDARSGAGCPQRRFGSALSTWINGN
ncbi:hypothetical protein MRX96_059041 [Rhipicephalus microplus]